MHHLWSEELCEQSENMRSGGFIDLADALDQPGLVHCPDLVQHDLPGFSFKSKRHAGGVRTSLCGHRCHDDGVDMMVHFVWRNDETRAGLADFTAFGGVEPNEKDVESGSYHVQSFRSHWDVDGVS